MRLALVDANGGLRWIQSEKWASPPSRHVVAFTKSFPHLPPPAEQRPLWEGAEQRGTISNVTGFKNEGSEESVMEKLLE
jgi:hypothetical protein